MTNIGSITITGPTAINDFRVGAPRLIPLLNSGDIYLNNTICRQMSPILGPGCTHIHGQSKAIFYRPAERLHEQTFFMVGPQAGIPINSDLTIGINVTVAGFGDGNTIEMPNAISQFTYDVNDGGRLIIYANALRFIIHLPQFP